MKKIVLLLLVAAMLVTAVAVAGLYITADVPNPDAGKMPAECTQLLEEVGINPMAPCPISGDQLLRIMQTQFPAAGPLWWVKFRDAALSGCPQMCSRIGCKCEYNIHALRGVYSEYLAEEANLAAAPSQTTPPKAGIFFGLIVEAILWVTLYFALWGVFQIEIIHELKIKASILIIYLALIGLFPEKVTFGTVSSETVWILWVTIGIILVQPLLSIVSALIGYFNSEVVSEMFHESPFFSILWAAGKGADAVVSAPSTLIGNISTLAYVTIIGISGYIGIDFMHALMPILFGMGLAPGLTKLAGNGWTYYSIFGTLIKMGVFDPGEGPKPQK